MRLAIIVLNFNNYKDTIACIKSLLAFLDCHTHLYVVDNNSSDNSIFFLKKAFNSSINPYLTFIQHGQNGGYAAGNNVGIKYAREKMDYDYYWILNNDTVVPDKSFLELISYAELHPEFELIGTVQVYYEKPDIVQSVGGRYHSPSGICTNIYQNKPVSAISTMTVKPDYPSGASLLVKKSFLEKVGLFNETYFLYFEEIDWIIRARQIYRNKFWDICKNCLIWHKEGGTDKNHGKSRSALSEYYFHRNRMMITSRYYPAYRITVLFFLIISVLKRLFSLQPKSAINICKAIRDGCRFSKEKQIMST